MFNKNALHTLPLSNGSLCRRFIIVEAATGARCLSNDSFTKIYTSELKCK